MAAVYAATFGEYNQIVLFDVRTIFSGSRDVHVVRNPFQLFLFLVSSESSGDRQYRVQVSRLFNENARLHRFGSNIVQCRQQKRCFHSIGHQRVSSAKQKNASFSRK